LFTYIVFEGVTLVTKTRKMRMMTKDVNTKITEPVVTPVEAPVIVEPVVEVKPVEVINPEIQRRRKFDSEIVSGTFHYTQMPGGTLEFCYKKYKGDPIKKYSLVDGMHYDIPRGVANHLNDNCGVPVHQYVQDEKGTPIAKLTTPYKRFMFSSDFGVYKPETRLSVVSKL